LIPNKNSFLPPITLSVKLLLTKIKLIFLNLTIISHSRKQTYQSADRPECVPRQRLCNLGSSSSDLATHQYKTFHWDSQLSMAMKTLRRFGNSPLNRKTTSVFKAWLSDFVRSDWCWCWCWRFSHRRIRFNFLRIDEQVVYCSISYNEFGVQRTWNGMFKTHWFLKTSPLTFHLRKIEQSQYVTTSSIESGNKDNLKYFDGWKQAIRWICMAATL